MHFFYIIYGILVLSLALLMLLLFGTSLPMFMQKWLLVLLRKIRYPLRIVFAFLTYLCWDALNDMYKHQEAVHVAKDSSKTYSQNQLDMHIHLLSSKFRSERNFYLCAFTWTLCAIIMRFESILAGNLSAAAKLEAVKTPVTVYKTE